MTVRDLIEALKEFPEDTPVKYYQYDFAYSDYDLVNLEVDWDASDETEVILK